MDGDTITIECLSHNPPQKVLLPKKYVSLWQTINEALETNPTERTIALPHIHKITAQLIIETYVPEIYRCKKKLLTPQIANGIRTHIKTLLNQLSLQDLYTVMKAADYLNIPELIQLSCKVWIHKSVAAQSFAHLHEKNNQIASYMLVPTLYVCIYNQLAPSLTSYLYRRHIATRNPMPDTILLQLEHNDHNIDDDGFNNVLFNTDNTHIAAGSNRGIIYIQPINKKYDLLTLLDHHQAITSLCFSPTNPFLLASGSYDHTIKLWDLEKDSSLIHTFEGHTTPVSNITFNPTGTHLVSTSIMDNTTRIWNITTKQCIQILPIEEYPWRVKFLNNTTFACATCANAIYFWQWNAATNMYKNIDILKQASFGEFGFNHTNNTFATDTHSGTILLVDFNTKNLIYRFLKHTDTIYGLCFNHAGNLLASASDDKTICIWDLSTKQCIQRLHHGAAVKAIDFTADDTALISASHDGTVRIWQLVTPNHKAALDSLKQLTYSCDPVTHTDKPTIVFDQLRLLAYISSLTQKNQSLNLNEYPYLHNLFMAFNPDIQQFLMDTLNIQLSEY